MPDGSSNTGPIPPVSVFADTASCERKVARGGWAEDLALHRCTGAIGPRNTWSNAAYLLAGLTLALTHQDAPSLVLAASLGVLGIGSGLYHYYKTLWANKLDRFGMYMVFGALTAYALTAPHTATPYLMVLTGLGFAVLFNYVIPNVNLDLQMGLLFWCCALAAFTHGQSDLALYGVCTFLIAFAVWHLDKEHHPIVGLWGHASWHVITAIAIPLLYLGLQP